MKIVKAIAILVVSLVLGCSEKMQEEQPQQIASNEAVAVAKQSVVFIAGFDEGSNRYYSNANRYFKNQGYKIVDHLFSASEILQWLNTNHNYKQYDQIHIVSHSNAWRGMSMKIAKEGERITLNVLADALENGELPKLEAPITKETKVVFHSCGLGDNPLLLSKLREVFTSIEAPEIFASPMFNVFGGKYAGHYLARPYYIFYPTAESPGPLQLAGEFNAKYPEIIDIDWYAAIKTRKEQSAGEVYSYKFNVPVTWEFSFENKDEIPKLKDREDIMDWVSENEEIAMALYKLSIPIEKYRWKSSVKENKLIIKGKSTVLCVLKPLMNKKDTSEYKVVSLSDAEQYRRL